ncbi:MAG: GNAT family N-acetyltransferase [Fimbriimonadaceae bacterium]
MGGDYAINERYRERLLLPDGRTATLRMVAAEDKPLFQAALARYSDSVTYFRFFIVKKQFTPRELQWLTEFDGYHHLAMGITSHENGQEIGVGVARFVRSRDEPDHAEVAFALGDPFQGLGLGKLLLSRLARAAIERGIRFFCCDVLAENRRAHRFLSQYQPESLPSDDPLIRRYRVDARRMAGESGQRPQQGDLQ